MTGFIPIDDDDDWCIEHEFERLYSNYTGRTNFCMSDYADNSCRFVQRFYPDPSLPDPIESLLRAWIGAELRVISEFSSDFNTSWRDLIAHVKERTGALGIPWDDEFFPEYIRESLEGE